MYVIFISNDASYNMFLLFDNMIAFKTLQQQPITYVGVYHILWYRSLAVWRGKRFFSFESLSQYVLW